MGVAPGVFGGLSRGPERRIGVRAGQGVGEARLAAVAEIGPAATALAYADPLPGGDASRFTGTEVWQHISRANVGGRIPRARTEIAGAPLEAGAAVVSIVPACFESWTDVAADGEFDGFTLNEYFKAKRVNPQSKSMAPGAYVFEDPGRVHEFLEYPELLAALEQIEDFRNLAQLADKVITSTKALKAAKRANGGELTKKEKKEQSETAKLRTEIRKKLQKLLARIPVFMYVTQFRELAVRDIIVGVDSDLFERVTGLTVEDFTLLNDIGGEQ